MADSFTAKLNLTKPEVGASTDTWGTKINSDLDSIDALFDTGPYLKVSKGGTGAGTAADARTALGLGALATKALITSSDITDGTIVYADIQNISATSRVLGRKTSGAGVTEELTLSDVLDFVGSAAQGDILYRGSSAWSRLAAGTSGQVLTSGGAAANPSWTSPASQTWVNFNGTGTVAIRQSSNVSSITDSGTGYYTVNFTTNLADADYAAVVSCFSGTSTNDAYVASIFNSKAGGTSNFGEVAPLNSAFTIVVTDSGNGWTAVDSKYICAAVLR